MGGAHFRRPISLGVRVRSPKVSEVSELCDRLDVGIILASRKCIRILPHRYHCSSPPWPEQSKL
ncbi:hypothetical protein DH86_00002239 [Scytalidium sp. 3C]|nr:hypothetical protein DH86_00002239 [Scytalidium sp. 3C]